MNFSKKDYELLKYLVKLSQTGMMQAMGVYLRKIYNKVVITDDYIYAEGDIPVALIAHMDTVFHKPAEHIYYDREENVIWSPEGLGADDRAGIFGIIKILQSGRRPSVILTTDEEKGGLGAYALCKQVPQPFTELKYLIELDRRGSNDCVFYECDNKDFETYVNSFGFKSAWGTFSDISTICEKWKIAGVNLSIGYFDEHNKYETLFPLYMLNTITRVKKMLDDSVNVEQFEFVPSMSYYKWSKNYDWYDDYNYAYGYGEYLRVRCKVCNQLHTDYETIPVKGINESYIICGNCLAKKNNIDFCASCGEAFESPTGSEHNWLCEDCKKSFVNRKGKK